MFPKNMAKARAASNVFIFDPPLYAGLCGNPPSDSRALAQKDVGRAFARDVLCAFIAQSTHIDGVQKMLPGTEQDRPDGEMQLINQGGTQILPNRGYAATEADVAAVRCSGRLLPSGVYASGNK